ncbi:MAG TPA: MFS transporter, partial [Steroidobacteraceae bacterium]|nr:MFS transporter [Steroidobacteraceae bacterium]
MNETAATIVAHSRAKAVFVCTLAALAGLMFGLDVGVISGATQFIQKEFAVSDYVIGWIVSGMMLGAAIGAAGSGWMAAALGRKRSLMLGAVLFVAGSLL